MNLKNNFYIHTPKSGKRSCNYCSISAFRAFIIVVVTIVFFATPDFTISAEAIPGYKKKTVIFGGDSSNPPYEFIDNNGSPAGFTVDLTKAISEEMGWNVELKLGDIETIYKELESGNIDIVQKAVLTDENLKIYNYSIPYHEFRYSVFINSTDIYYFNSHHLEGLNPVTYKRSFIDDYIKKNSPDKKIKYTDRLIDSISHISLNHNSYTILNKYLGLYLTKTYGIENVVPAGDPIIIEKYYYISLKKDKQLISGINEGLKIIKINGRYGTIYNKWFGIVEENYINHIVLKIMSLIFIPVILLYLAILIWSWTLKKKIKTQTIRLSEELTRHKFSEKALMESEERSRLIIEHAPLGILHFNPNGEITTCNDSLARILDSTRDRLIGFNMLNIPDTELAASIKKVINGETGYFEGEYRSVTSTKSTNIRAMFTPIKLPNGSITGGLGIIEDNTSRKKYEEDILAAKETAESANSIKSDFLANMSHEVRTPLNGILGMLQLIQTTGVNDEQANYVNIAMKSGMRLTRLLNDILDLSRVESDKLVLNETQFSLRDIFSFIKERYFNECEEKGVKLLLNIEEGVPDEVIGDEIRIRQILVNLVSNAVKFTKNGEISVNISAENVSLYGEVNIIISVKDTGIGIANDMLTRIFEPFRQGENSYRRTFQGAGLGLTLVKHLVNLMNGTINIDSNPGEGTFVECSITVKLPENQAIILKPVLNEKLNKSGNMCTILIAEDERINRLALKRILEKSGYRILEAENGIETLKILKKENPDCILMDIQMPEMDGIEATKRIRKREEFGDKSDIPIIALTAYTMPEDREKISAAGLDDYISKPVNMDYLIKTVSRFIERDDKN